MKTKLSPGDDFKKFLERADAAGQRDKTIGQFRHKRFAFVHGLDDAQVRQSAMADFLGHEGFWNDADDVSARCENRIGNYTHEADISSAIHEFNAASGEFSACVFRSLSI